MARLSTDFPAMAMQIVYPMLAIKVLNIGHSELTKNFFFKKMGNVGSGIRHAITLGDIGDT